MFSIKKDKISYPRLIKTQFKWLKLATGKEVSSIWKFNYLEMQIKGKFNKNKTACVLNFLLQNSITGIILNVVSGSMVQKTSLKTHWSWGYNCALFLCSEEKLFAIFPWKLFFNSCTHQFLSVMWLCECCSLYPRNLSSSLHLVLSYSSSNLSLLSPPQEGFS